MRNKKTAKNDVVFQIIHAYGRKKHAACPILTMPVKNGKGQTTMFARRLKEFKFSFFHDKRSPANQIKSAVVDHFFHKACLRTP